MTFPSIELTSDSSFGQCIQGTIVSSKKSTTTLKMASCGSTYQTVVCRAAELVNIDIDCNGTTYLKHNEQTNNSLEYTFDQQLKDENVKAISQQKVFYQNVFSRLDPRLAYESIFSMLWYSTIPCFDVREITSSGIWINSITLQTTFILICDKSHEKSLSFI